MDFKENDLVVIKGKRYSDSGEEVLADVYEILFVGRCELLVKPRTKYGKDPFKIKKSRCISLRMDHVSDEEDAEIVLGSLVLGIDTEFDGTIKRKVIGHVSQIINNHNSRDYYMINSDNIETMFEKSKVLLLQ